MRIRQERQSACKLPRAELAADSVRRTGGFRRSESLRRELAALPGHVLANDFSQPQRGGTGVIAVGEYQVEIGAALAALAQRQRLEFAALQFAAYHVVREPGESQAHAGGMNRRRLVAHGPALLRAQPAAAAALAARVADDEVALLAQILQRQFAPEPMQRMFGMRHRDEAQRYQGISGKARRHLRTNGQINLSL